MANLSVTTGGVQLASVSGSTIEVVQFGEAALPGMPVYRASTNPVKWWKCINSDSTKIGATGILLTKITNPDEYGVIVKAGRIILGGATTVKGAPYYVSATSGLLCPFADLVSTNYVVHIGNAINITGELELVLRNLGIQI